MLVSYYFFGGAAWKLHPFNLNTACEMEETQPQHYIFLFKT